MRYMFLIYSREGASAEAPAQDVQKIINGHWMVMDETKEKGIFVAADPLQSTATATTVRNRDGKFLVLDGPFAETKEQLAGYYIIDCKNLDEAIEWAMKIPSSCKGSEGCVEIRPIGDIPPR
jgi:hypothetical protein